MENLLCVRGRALRNPALRAAADGGFAPIPVAE
jgi:hypothetical protein